MKKSEVGLDGNESLLHHLCHVLSVRKSLPYEVTHSRPLGHSFLYTSFMTEGTNDRRK